MATNSWMESMGFPSEVIEEYERTGRLPDAYAQQSTTGPSPVIGVDQRDTGGERTGTPTTTTAGFTSDIDKENEAVHNRLNTLKAGSSTTEDSARNEYRSYIESLGGHWSPETENDFNNLWRQSAEASSFGGAGIDRANTFASNFAGFKPRLEQRWLGEAGQDDYDSSGRYYGSNTATTQYTGGGQGGFEGGGGGTGTGTGGGPSGDDALAALLKYLQESRGKSDAENAELRAILMKQLGELDDPVSTDDPGLREAIAANRLGLQRGTEAQRREAAERRAYDESGGVGSAAYQNDIDRLLQEQGESGAMFEGQIVFQEMQQRRSQLNNLLSQAMALGDAEAARLIQTELATINSQLAQSNFYDQLGFNYADMENRNNLDLIRILFGGGNISI